MNRHAFTPVAIAFACLGGMTACQTAAPGKSRVSRAELERQLAESRELAARYEQRYGKLLASRPAHDLRKLRVQLKDKPMSAVVALLGKPASVYTSATTESWDYNNVAYDSASGRTVRNLAIWFRKGVVERMNATF